ncbi:MAG: signal peptidase II [Treponema sp.]|jgi:signal peptidase II|nr:signal peptidase II [Treponema sp.]
MNVFIERKKHILISLGVCTANFLLDRLTKVLASSFLDGKSPIRLLYNMVILVYQENDGAFLSLGASWHPALKYALLLFIPVGVCLAAFIYIMFWEQKVKRAVCIACIIGGGIGNLIDRIFHDFKVIDFMNFGIGNIRTGILNAADLSVCAGVVILIIFEWRSESRLTS